MGHNKTAVKLQGAPPKQPGTEFSCNPRVTRIVELNPLRVSPGSCTQPCSQILQPCSLSQCRCSLWSVLQLLVSWAALRTRCPTCSQKLSCWWALQLCPSIPVKQHPVPKAPHTTEKKDVPGERCWNILQRHQNPKPACRLMAKSGSRKDHRKLEVIKILLCKNSRAWEGWCSWLGARLHHSKMLLLCSQLQ